MHSVIKDYMHDTDSRHALNALTQTVFGFDFEDWYRGGFFEGAYVPHTVMENGKALANVSANLLDFHLDGEERRYVQIGTVMTHPDHRRQGLAKQLMEEVQAEYADRDGIYLFANLNALDLYRKCGLTEVTEYRYCVDEDTLAKIMPAEERFAPADDLNHYLSHLRNAVSYSRFDLTDRYSLAGFYTGHLENVYFCRALDVYAVLESDGDTLYINGVFAPERIPLAVLLAHLPAAPKQVVLGYTPFAEDAAICHCEVYDGADDYRLFVKGEKLLEISDKKLFFPVLSHA